MENNKGKHQDQRFRIITRRKSSSLEMKNGRVIDTHAGKDGLVRIVTIRTATGITKRSIAKLCKLPITNTPDEED